MKLKLRMNLVGERIGGFPPLEEEEWIVEIFMEWRKILIK
jgi:hypothetical protein